MSIDLNTIHNPKRLEGENYEDYKYRRMKSKELIKLYEQGKVIKWAYKGKVYDMVKNEEIK